MLTSVWTGSKLTIHMPEEAWEGQRRKERLGLGCAREMRVVGLFRVYTLCCFQQLSLSNVALLLN